MTLLATASLLTIDEVFVLATASLHIRKVDDCKNVIISVPGKSGNFFEAKKPDGISVP